MAVQINASSDAITRQELAIKDALSNIQKAPEDQMFGLSAAFRADDYARKVDLGPGAYRDSAGKRWILPVVRKAEDVIRKDPSYDHEYIPIAGRPEFVQASQRLIFGPSSDAIREGRVASCQTLSGTGALSLAARFLSQCTGAQRVHVSDPAYVNHIPILNGADLHTSFYSYYSSEAKGLNFEAMCRDMISMPDHSIVLLHACAHNPTGVDPSREQWMVIARIMRSKNLLPFFDSAYQGFASGDLDDDAWAIRHFVEQNFDALIVAQSYAKNFGLYGERVGCLHIVTSNADRSVPILSQLQRLQRISVSTPPAYGARIVTLVLNDHQLFAEWKQDLLHMSGRMKAMRRALREHLERTGGRTWQHITDQIGMFCYTGITCEQVKVLRDQYHIYMVESGRISISGLNDTNVEYVARAINHVQLRSSRL